LPAIPPSSDSVATLLVALAIGIPGAWMLALNWVSVVRTLRGKRAGSPFPLVGGVLVSVAIVLAGSALVRWAAWIPLVLDPGSPLFLLTLYRWARGPSSR
jgi:hypothetical protein